MQHDLIRLLYVSTARRGITEADVDRIVTSAKLYNAAHGITGGLAFNGRRFCQCLEGPQETVLRLLRKIRQDDRHEDLLITDMIHVDYRYFDSWGMQWIFEQSFSELREAVDQYPIPKFD